MIKCCRSLVRYSTAIGFGRIKRRFTATSPSCNRWYSARMTHFGIIKVAVNSAVFQTLHAMHHASRHTSRTSSRCTILRIERKYLKIVRSALKIHPSEIVWQGRVEAITVNYISLDSVPAEPVTDVVGAGIWSKTENLRRQTNRHFVYL